ncbi:hypothetical protein EYC80_005141 [Monilinia laxa]|uniref:Uncharacterized protein n=1 Tax=Monilinia laxa TaxID=61186 RepID=A0A5N6KJK0_MONLA|nr:hypothetical protein EYC80_005141 [Monilinia laxa]
MKGNECSIGKGLGNKGFHYCPLYCSEMLREVFPCLNARYRMPLKSERKKPAPAPNHLIIYFLHTLTAPPFCHPPPFHSVNCNNLFYIL